jgi:hypothetical protein
MLPPPAPFEYEHDIFVSYRRSDDLWIRWTKENLVRALWTLLRPGLGSVSIFMDESIETGADWPHYLARHLSRSKIMFAILSRDYFQSNWCRLELALMHKREELTNFRTSSNPAGLIVPVVIDDGTSFPAEVRKMQSEPLNPFANPFMRIESPKQEELAEVLKQRVCPTVERALNRAPAFDPGWEQLAHKQFEHMFRIQTPIQSSVPALVLPSLP